MIYREKHARMISALNDLVHKGIEEFAKVNGITYEEASKKVYLTVCGIKIEPIENSSINYEPEKSK